MDYIPPKLATGKEWYIYYSIKNPSTKKMKRVRIKVNRIPMKERKAACKKIMADIATKLALGWNPLIEAASPKAYETLDDAMSAFLKIKGRETEENTMRCYRSYIKIFRKWADGAGMGPGTYACVIDRKVALAFMNDVDDDEDISPRTYNNYLRFYKTMFNWMQGKGYVSENPFEGILPKSKKLTSKSRRILTQEELGRLFSFLQEHNVQYLRAALLCYCCLLRPKEIAMLKCGDIDLDKHVVRVRAEIAKNDNTSFRTIPDDLVPILRSANLSRPDWYLISDHGGYDFSPGPKMICSRKLAKYWQDHIRKECDFGQDVQFYSLKDTGITSMLDSGIPINMVQQQADHSSVAMTAIYVGHHDEAQEELRKATILQISK